MVAYLEKSTENADFAEIVYFLNANPIRYALTVSPTIYVSCIEQVWSTAKIKTVNNETQIHAKVEGKTIVISESSVKRDLQFNDEDDETVTKKRVDRMERAATTGSSLEAEQDSGNINRTQSMATLNEPFLKELVQVVVLGAKIPYWGMQKLKLGQTETKELMELYTKLSDRVLNLETTKTAQAKEIAYLKKRVKKLERKRKSRTPGMNLFKIDMDHATKDVEGDAEQVISAAADEVSTGDAVNTAGTEVNTASAPVTTAGISVTTAEPSTPLTTTTTVIKDEDLTIAQTLVKMRSEKSKERGVVMKEPNYELAVRLQAEEQGELTVEENLRLCIDSFVLMDSKVVKHRAEGSETREKGSSKRAGEDLQQESTKKQKVDDDDKEEEDLKQCFEIIPEEVAINALPLATNPAPIFDIKDLENLWKLVKAKHGYKMPEEAIERVLWGDLKVMFKPHKEDALWMNLQGQKILLWKLYDSCGVHFVRFQNMHIYMLVEKTYYLILATITEMLNKEMQAEH
ncbi:hypothetical protein Tco_0627467 [Tanacetum coccineum]|uniref:Xylulose kinase-1 n=1 Tax=Tanacetum coccineum TaxID=301880 RepID=A0ABQ4WMG9_9ASTR